MRGVKNVIHSVPCSRCWLWCRSVCVVQNTPEAPGHKYNGDELSEQRECTLSVTLLFFFNCVVGLAAQASSVSPPASRVCCTKGASDPRCCSPKLDAICGEYVRDRGSSTNESISSICRELSNVLNSTSIRGSNFMSTSSTFEIAQNKVSLLHFWHPSRSFPGDHKSRFCKLR